MCYHKNQLELSEKGRIPKHEINKVEEIRATKKPKKPLECFIEACKNRHIEKHGKVGEEEVSLTEFTKKCSERWRTMTEKEKRRFNQMADADKKECIGHLIKPSFFFFSHC